MSKRYENLGVSASKDEIHEAIKNLDKGLYSNAFCKVLPDLVAGDLRYCNLIHADTAGTKTSLAYLYWKETNDLSVWDGIAQDALVMNIDDLACVGLSSDIVISSTIGRNKHLIPGNIIDRLISSNETILRNLQKQDINIYSGGGETADVGDIVRTIDVGITAFGRMKRSDVINIDIKPGSVIVGFASYGQASYESQFNSGIGSNGLTAARHDALSKYYLEHYPESSASETNSEFQYTGKYRLTDQFTWNEKKYEIGKLLLSPTRTYLPLIHNILAKYRQDIQGMIHCTGGAQTKVKKFIKNCRIVKDNLFPLPPVFEMLKSCTLCSDHEMYEVYNMGHRLEIYV
ncbi:MAG: AIR synthase related protein, partial [Saprospiraceae bacterium]